MLRERFWCLTIEFWHGDLEAGAKPTEGVTHRRHLFYFRHPPMRAEFLDICRCLPWTSVWADTLLPTLAKHPWPMIDYMHKSAGVELLDQSKLVGRVNIYREDRCWFRNLDPFPARIIVVHENQCGANFDDLDNLPKIADLGLRFLPKGHKIVCSRLKRIVAKYGEFAWVHYGYHAAVLVVGVTPAS